MNQVINKTEPGRWSGFSRKARKIFYWIIAFVLIFTGISIYSKYFFTYSEGYRAGFLQKFSHKGNIFKTYEGEMVLSSVSTNNNMTIASEKFLFSVINKDLIHHFDTIQGETVIVHYIQKNGTLFWRGDSEYLVDSVKVKR